MGQAGDSAELFLVSFSNAALTELRTQNLQASSSHDICTSFSLKSTGRGTLGWAFARKTEALSVSSTVLGKLPALRRAKSSPFSATSAKRRIPLVDGPPNRPGKKDILVSFRSLPSWGSELILWFITQELSNPLSSRQV